MLIKDFPTSIVIARHLCKFSEVLGEVFKMDLSPSNGLVLRDGRIHMSLNIMSAPTLGLWRMRKGIKSLWIDFPYEKLPIFYLLYDVIDHVLCSCIKRKLERVRSISLVIILLKFKDKHRTLMQVKLYMIM